MKTKLLLTIFTIGFIVNVFSQKATLELTFTSENNGLYVPLDSVFVENLTQGGDLTLYAPDTVLILDYLTGISTNESNGESAFSVSQNYPNPFKNKTEVSLYLLEKENIKISVRDILGRELAQYENTLIQGSHSFAFYPGNDKYYLLTVIGKQTSKTIKMLNSNCNTAFGGKCKIVYIGSEFYEGGFKSQQDINDFDFNLGDELKFIAYSIFEATEIIDSPMSNQIYTFQFDGWNPCPGLPTVTDIDGNTYNTVQIGNQCWMKENLKTTTYQNGTSIPNVPDSLEWLEITTGAYVWYNNDISWKNVYGAIYNWYAADDVNGLCPTAWHVPTDEEWTELSNFIGGTGSPYGNQLKSCRQVDSPLGEGCFTSEHPRWDTYNANYGTDDYGFSGLPGGGRGVDAYPYVYAIYYNLGTDAVWWSSSQTEDGYPIARWLYSGSSLFGGAGGGQYQYYGKSIRCLRD